MGLLDWLLPRPDRKPADVPQTATRWLSDSEVQPVSCPPCRADMPRISVLEAAKETVQPKAAHGFLIRSKSSSHKEPLVAKARDGERILYLLVGGAYILAHSLDTHTGFSLAKITGDRVFTVNYRKSLSADSAFPACLWDALAGWQYLIEELGFRPENIVVCGDSAGGNLSLAMVRYLDELRSTGYTTWGLPRQLFLNSPWADPTASIGRAETFRRTNMIGIYARYIVIPSHVRHFQSPAANPYICPALCGYDLFKRLAQADVKVYVSAGADEVLLDEILLLKDKMVEQGLDVFFRTIPHGTHSAFAEFERKTEPQYERDWLVVKKDFSAFWFGQPIERD